MVRPHWAIVILTIIAVGQAFFRSQATAAEPRVTLELIMESGVAPQAAQEWIQALKSCGADDLRIRSSRPGDEGRIETRGTASSPSYYVTGLLGSNDRLRLPGAKRAFSQRDAAGVRQYIETLRLGGEKELVTPKGAFGLTAEELVDVHKRLSRPVIFSTKGKRTGDVVRQMLIGLPVKVVVDESARPAFAGDDAVAEELQAISTGTAMAAAIRPLGLVILPFKPVGGELQVAIMDVRRTTQSWPVGWPPEETPGKAMPSLYKFLSVEIDDFALSDALDAIGGRLGSPILFDHNSLAREGISPNEVRVSLPKGKTYYKKIIDRLLSQAKLKSEIRVDEAGEPFLWVSTLK